MLAVLLLAALGYAQETVPAASPNSQPDAQSSAPAASVPAATPDQKITEWKEGAPGCSVDVNHSKNYSGPGLAFSVNAAPFQDDYWRIDISLANGSDTPIHFGPESLQVSNGKKNFALIPGKKVANQLYEKARDLADANPTLGRTSAGDWRQGGPIVVVNGKKMSLNDFIEKTQLEPSDLSKGQQAHGTVYIFKPGKKDKLTLMMQVEPGWTIRVPLN